MKYMIMTLLGLIIAAASVSVGKAENMTVEITPGKYEIKKETSTNLNPEPVTRNELACITKSKFDPEDALPDKEGCTVSNLKKKGNKVSFNIDCKGSEQMPAMSGGAEYNVTKTTFSWNLNMKGTMQGQEVTVNSKGNGKRVGECE